MDSILISRREAEILRDMINAYNESNGDGREIVAVLEYIINSSGVLDAPENNDRKEH